MLKKKPTGHFKAVDSVEDKLRHQKRQFGGGGIDFIAQSVLSDEVELYESVILSHRHPTLILINILVSAISTLAITFL